MVGCTAMKSFLEAAKLIGFHSSIQDGFLFFCPAYILIYLSRTEFFKDFSSSLLRKKKRKSLHRKEKNLYVIFFKADIFRFFASPFSEL